MAFLDGITTMCFGASYAVVLVLELIRLFRSNRALQLAVTLLGAAGLLAHTLYLIARRPSLASQGGSLLFLAWILAVFYFYGSFHYRKLAWGIFVLPVVLGLVILAVWFPAETSEGTWLSSVAALRGERFWVLLHVGLLLLAAVGGCIGFVASIMYLIQARRLRLKAAPGHGLRLLSLERLEAMNRRAINLAFPLLTTGVLIGTALLVHRADRLEGWTDPRVVGGIVLWVAFALLLYLRYGVHLRGRQLAFLTIMVFLLMMFTLVSSHSSVQGSSP